MNNFAFVDAAIHKLSGAVSAQDRSAAATGVTGTEALLHALDHVLRHFGCAVDGMSLAASVRQGDDAEATIRRVVERHHIHVRQVEIDRDETRTFGGPVLAFRGSTAVVLLPGMWRRWAEVSAGAAKSEALQPHAFTFYRMLSPEPSRVRDFLRLVCSRESRADLLWAVAWGIIAAALGTVSVYLTRWLVDWALPLGDKAGLTLLATGWAVVAFTSANLRLSRALLQSRVGARVDVNTEAALVGRALSLPMSVFKGLGAGDLAERIGDACQFGKTAYGMVTETVISLGTLIGYAVMLESTSAKATLVIGVATLLRALVSGLAIVGMYYEERSRRSTAVV